MVNVLKTQTPKDTKVKITQIILFIYTKDYEIEGRVN